MAAETFTYSGNVYTAGVAGTTDFALISSAAKAIEYLEPSHIHVYTSANEGASWTELTRPAQWDFIGSGTSVRLASGIAAGTWVKVQRITPSDGQYVTFQPSSQLVAEQLNDDTLFNTYLNQERLDESVRSNLLSLEAIDTATAASSAAAAAASDATSALQASSSAVQDASAALSAASAASSNASAAVSTANAAASAASTALSTASAASASAASAVATASTADSKADQALAAVSEALFYQAVANVAAIPSAPADGDAVEVGDSTGIESFSPLSNLPQGFIGDSGLSVRLIYQSAAASWLWAQYYPRDPDNRYLNPTDQAALDASISAAQSAAAAAQSTANSAATAATVAQSMANSAISAAAAAQSTADSALKPAAVGVTVQGYDADLQAIAGLASAADRVPYYTGAGTAALAALTPKARELLDDENVTAMRGTLGVDAAFSTTVTATSKLLGNRERCSVTAAGQTITLPLSPQPGWEVAVIVAGDFSDTVIARNGANIMSLAEDMTIDRGYTAVGLYYVDATRGWRII